jgi:CII-binding regulator of phage lambda lysogenization HflD
VVGFLETLAGWFGSKPAPTPVVPDAGTSTPRFSAEDPRLPDASRPIVARMLALIADIEARTQDESLLVSALAEVRQMRDSHLPRLVLSYAEIPPEHRAEIFRKTGRSASYNLNQGLEKMVARLETLSRSLAQEDLDSFADNLRFIDHRYGSDDPLR